MWEMTARVQPDFRLNLRKRQPGTIPFKSLSGLVVSVVQPLEPLAHKEQPQATACGYYSNPHWYLNIYINSGARTSVIVDKSLISTCRPGPAVSLNGSPTVSPTTAALWASDRLPPYMPVSINFFALSQAPPPLFRKVATSIPAIVPTIRNAATVSAPIPSSLNTTPTAIGIPTARIPGRTICLRAPIVTISTQRA